MQKRWFSIPAIMVMGICLLTGSAQGADVRKLMKSVKATYPPLALQSRLEGTVKVQAVVGANGTVTNVIVVNGPMLLRNAAVECVKQWQYEAAKDTTLIPIEIVFKLN